MYKIENGLLGHAAIVVALLLVPFPIPRGPFSGNSLNLTPTTASHYRLIRLIFFRREIYVT